jgi:dolichol kinase
MNQDYQISYKQEWLRKLIHLSSLWMPILYYFQDKQSTLILVGVVMCIVLLADIGRHYLPITGRLFNALFGNMLRGHEKHQKKLSGASYTLIAGFITILLFSKPVAIAAISILVISDAFAALVGRKYGSIPLAGKSLQGTATFYVFAVAITLGVATLFEESGWFMGAGIVASFIATLAELFSKRIGIDDNITIPFSYGIVMFLLAV